MVLAVKLCSISIRRRCASVAKADNVFLSRDLQKKTFFNPKLTPPRQILVENFDSPERKTVQLMELHPKIFAAFPRPDLIQLNHYWQSKYRQVDWLSLRTRAEFSTGGYKPWPQKGTGRARHGSIRGPQWREGGWCHGPRGPRTHFYMLPFFTRVRGLTACLSAKFAQDDLKVVDTLERFPSEKSDDLFELVEKREWGPSVLIVDKQDIFPKNISLATENVNHIALMPVYGLNVFSMLKFETLVLTVAAVEEIEEKLLYHFSRTDLKGVTRRPFVPLPDPQERVF